MIKNTFPILVLIWCCSLLTSCVVPPASNPVSVSAQDIENMRRLQGHWMNEGNNLGIVHTKLTLVGDKLLATDVWDRDDIAQDGTVILKGYETAYNPQFQYLILRGRVITGRMVPWNVSGYVNETFNQLTLHHTNYIGTERPHVEIYRKM